MFVRTRKIGFLVDKSQLNSILFIIFLCIYSFYANSILLSCLLINKMYFGRALLSLELS